MFYDKMKNRYIEVCVKCK